MTVQPSVRRCAPPPPAAFARSSVGVNSIQAGVCPPRADQRMVASCARLRDERFLVRVAVGDERAVGRDDQREAALADADAVDHPPHLFEAEFADQPAGRLVQAASGGWRTPLVGSRSSSTRIGDMATPSMVSVASRRDRDARRADPAGGDDAAALRRTA